VLAELRVENYAVIDHLAIEFAPGLNLLTGETGAGKSLLVDALSLLSGEKASADVVRHGAEKAVLAAVFADVPKAIAKALEELGLESADEQLILRREIGANGKGRVFINDQPATVAALRRLAPALIVIHAQRESLGSLDAAARLEMVDRYAAADSSQTEGAYGEWRRVQARIVELEQDEQDRLRLVDLWTFQAKEIDAAKLEPGEDERLQQERMLLGNAEKLYAAAMSAYELLYDSSGSASATLRSASRSVEELARYQGQFSEMAGALDAARITIEDAASTLRDFSEQANASPERLADVEDRLATLDRLKRKYGSTVEQVITYGEEVARKLHEIEFRDDVLRQLRADLARAAEQYREAARELSKKRFAAARELEKLVEAEVNELAMKARFKVELSGTDDEQNWTAQGFDSAEFLIATNAGEPLGPLDRIASGGELSRTLLGLKVSVERGPANQNGHRKAASARTMVFDEIDIGIGGRAAEAVGRKLKTLAAGDQVLCVTHLPQIASFADQHFHITKHEAAGRTRTAVRLLSQKERAEELARMISGAKTTESSLKHAEQMLKANA
jgi:DNA repair protein RecN (Recombination protein N)